MLYYLVSIFFLLLFILLALFCSEPSVSEKRAMLEIGYMWSKKERKFIETDSTK